MAKQRKDKHKQVSQKSKTFKKDLHKPKEDIKDPDDIVDAEGFVCLAAHEELPDEIEQELEAFRSNKVAFAEQVKDKLRDTSSLDPQIQEVYTNIGKILKTYRSGKIPKAFKFIPGLENWEEILYLTKPEEWSPQAMYQATSIFISNMNPKQAQKFLLYFLYPAFRDNIRKYKKLNYHLYKALKKAMYKPAGWVKGILIPLCEDGDCTLKEASIIGSIISKVCARS